MSDIYCITCKQLSDANHRNIFDEKLLINLQEKDAREKPNGYITLRDAIELIIGYTISEMNNAILCETCFHKVESYIKFRSQLVTSFATLNNTQISNAPGLGNVDVTNTLLIAKISNTESEVLKEITNVNESNVSSNYSNLSSSEAENDSSCYTNLPSNFHHHVDSVSDYGSDIDDNVNVDVYISDNQSKIQKSDIESDVNVCSGEDDEVLELPVEYKRNETVNISSTESEEDYDYGPTLKKIKLSNFISHDIVLV